MLNDPALHPPVDDQLASINPKEAALSQMFDFSPLQQITNEGGYSYRMLLSGKSSKLLIVARDICKKPFT